MSSLKKLGGLGRGGTGSVELVEHQETRDTYALKILSKGYIAHKKMRQKVFNEKFALATLDSPFIIKLYATYKDSQMLYFLLEAALGGELFTVYRQANLHGSERHGKFYVASVGLALLHLHDKRFVYRDLKPENLILTERGYLKVTDMGLAKIVINKTYSTVGTPEYFAPEMIQTLGHSTALDWWTLGILTFELMSGYTPFHSDGILMLFRKVLKGIDNVHFPPSCRDVVESFLKGLLQNEPTERFPVRSGGAGNLQRHAWCMRFDWDALRAQTLAAPYLPEVKNNKDLSNFYEDEEYDPPFLEYVDNGDPWDDEFAE